MALVANSVIYPQGPLFNAGAVLSDGTETLLYTAGADGARIDVLSATCQDNADNTLAITIYDDAGSPVLKHKEIVPMDDGSGYSTTFTTQKPATDVLQLLKCSALDGSGIRHLYLEAGWSIKVAVIGALASESVWVFAQGWEY